MAIGRYDPDTARWVVDRIKWLLSQQYVAPGELLAALGSTADQNAIAVRNVDISNADAYACMQVTGVENPSASETVKDYTYLTVTQPTDQYGRDGFYVFNGPEPIAANGYGIAYDSPQILAIAAGSGSVGDRYLPQTSSWELDKDVSGPYVLAGSDDVASNTYRFFRDPIVTAWFTTPGGGIPAASSGTWGKATCTLRTKSVDGSGNVSLANAQDCASTSITHTVHNPSETAVGAGVDIEATLTEGLWEANWEDCT